mmetsp:Transcript_1236/g.2757  ORF Transcript_1236/g.2757 Transcript_1236/m.2757 type:complete len:231 (-) Transcript_1236:755-1447(-)
MWRLNNGQRLSDSRPCSSLICINRAVTMRATCVKWSQRPTHLNTSGFDAIWWWTLCSRALHSGSQTRTQQWYQIQPPTSLPAWPNLCLLLRWFSSSEAVSTPLIIPCIWTTPLLACHSTYFLRGTIQHESSARSSPTYTTTSTTMQPALFGTARLRTRASSTQWVCDCDSRWLRPHIGVRWVASLCSPIQLLVPTTAQKLRSRLFSTTRSACSMATQKIVATCRSGRLCG